MSALDLWKTSASCQWICHVSKFKRQDVPVAHCSIFILTHTKHFRVTVSSCLIRSDIGTGPLVTESVEITICVHSTPPFGKGWRQWCWAG
mmetsp:Transcript_44269/g.99125  ORF Transcript_44269/g.99125 Transcript_44269/m.99125 type:complete len:90 (-) Transcript_44269:877-1146(-)